MHEHLQSSELHQAAEITTESREFENDKTHEQVVEIKDQEQQECVPDATDVHENPEISAHTNQHHAGFELAQMDVQAGSGEMKTSSENGCLAHEELNFFDEGTSEGTPEDGLEWQEAVFIDVAGDDKDDVGEEDHWEAFADAFVIPGQANNLASSSLAARLSLMDA